MFNFKVVAFLCDVEKFSVREQDVTKKNEQLNNDLSKVIIADLPLVGNRTIPISKEDSFLSENKRTLYADWMMMYRILQRLNTGERAFILVTKGALVRGNESFLRKYFVDNDCVDTVITLPNSIYPNYNSPMNLLIFEKESPSKRKGKILFIDLNQKETLTEDLIKQVSIMFHEYRAEKEFARVVNYEEIVSREYILNPQIYLTDRELLNGQLFMRDIACVIDRDSVF